MQKKNGNGGKINLFLKKYGICVQKDILPLEGKIELTSLGIPLEGKVELTSQGIYILSRFSA